MNMPILGFILINEQEIRDNKKKRMKEVEKDWNKTEASVVDLIPKEGQLIAIKQWKRSPMRIGTATKVILHARVNRFR